MAAERRIIVGVSGSLRNLAAVYAAAQLAAEVNAHLIAIMTWLPPGGDQVACRSPCPMLDEISRQQTSNALAEALADVPGDIGVTAMVIRGQPGQRLVGYADRSTDTLVVGAGRSGPLQRLFHCYVAQHCVRHATCPVLTVPEPALVRALGLRQRIKFEGAPPQRR